ncbi:adenylyl-sulfate kinase [Helicobacter aurati]|uniref:Adenylyl-sulfate kinase n=1 Tax=Helicobacter aurati TaxID=137778 RepID=A0A3D8J2E5_9HELI|nr:adenylyl-sulfate kinase [Helicobacter aurati]RDU71678.1 adenylyl-sulfate kinase [Helicobacter aurati]
MLNGNGLVIWINGLSGSGKSTIGQALHQKIAKTLKNVVYLDGDVLRSILGHFAYDKIGRINMAKKRADLAHYLSQQGIIVIVTTISMFKEVYEYNANLFKHFLHVYVQCDIHELIARDQKSIYSSFLEGKIRQVVGMDIAYDVPPLNDGMSLVIDNNKRECLEQKVDSILSCLDING